MAHGHFDRIDPEVLLANAGWVRGLALQLIRDEAGADDVLQDTLTAAIVRPPRQSVSLRPWLARVARNFALRSLRSRSRRGKREAERVPRPTSPSVEESAARTEMFHEVVAAVLALEPVYRSVVTLKFFDGLGMSDVAEVLGIPIETARTRVKRALSVLRTRLDRKYGNRAAWALPFLPLDSLAQHAAVGATVATGTTAITIWAGGIMAVNKSAVAVVAGLLFLGGGAWWGLEHLDPRPSAESESSSLQEIPEATVAGEPLTRVELRGGAAPSIGAGPRTSSAVPGYGGTMLDEEGHPVPGAWLEVVSVAGLDTDVSSVPRIVPDETGRFGFEIPGAQNQVGVRIHAAAYVPRWGGTEPLVFPGSRAQIVLVKAAELRVLVLDDLTDRPVSGARVGTYDQLTRSVDEWRQMRPKHEATTDSTGRATVLAKPGAGLLLVQAEGYRAAMNAALEVARAGPEVTVRLGQGSTILGRIVDGAGNGREGILLDAMGFPPYEARTTTDAGGRFSLVHAPTQSEPPEPVLRYHLRLWAQMPGSGAGARFFHVEPPVRDGETAEVTLTWYDERPLAGRVRRADGRPLAGVTVTALPKGERLLNWSAQPVTTDADGRFNFERCVPGWILVQARKDGATGEPLADQLVELPPKGPGPEVDLVVVEPATASSARLAVRVLDSDGASVAGAIVRWSVTGPAGGSTISETRISADGAAILEQVHPGLQVWVDAPGYGPMALRVSEEDLARGTLDARFPSGVARGRAVRQDGSPIMVVLRATLVQRLPGVAHTRWSPGGAELRTDADGRFELRGLGEGDYQLSVPRMDWRLVGGWVPVKAGDADVSLVVGTEEELRDSFVEAQMLDGETGAPLRGWHLQLRLVRAGDPAEGDLVAYLQSVTGSESMFRTFHPVRPGIYDVVMPRMFGRREARATGVRVGPGHPRPHVTLTWDRGLAVTGRVLDMHGHAAASVTVEAAGQATDVGEDGTYRLSGLDEGPVDVRVAGRYAESEPRRIEVRPVDQGSIDFGVVTGGAIRLVPALPDGPLRRLLAVARPANGQAVTLDLTAEAYEMRRGRSEHLVLPRLAPGRWQVEVTWDGRRVALEEVEVRDRQTSDVRLKP